MKKLVLLLSLCVMLLLLASCEPADPDPSDTTGGDTTTGAALGVLSCVKESTEGLTDTWRVTLADGSSYTFTVQNGEKGDKGDPGAAGANGEQGEQGDPGDPGQNAAPLTVVSCTEISYENGLHTYEIRFSDGNTASFAVRDGNDGASGEPGEPGESATSPSVVSCEAVSTVGRLTTWRLTFSDGKTADFTVQNGEDGASGEDGESFATEEEWLALIEKMDALTEAFTVRTPDWSVGNSTVTDPTSTASTKVTNDRITGGAAPLTKKTMFGDSDKIYGIMLRSYGLYDSNKALLIGGEVTLEIQIRKADATNEAIKSTILKSYTVTVEAKGTADYKIPLEILASDLEGIGENDQLILGIYPISSETTYLCPSTNDTYKHITGHISGTSGPYINNGYYTVNTPGGGQGNSWTLYKPDILFVTAEKLTMIDLGDLGSGGNGSAGNDTEEEEDRGILRLPEKYDLVVGDTFELFYKGIAECLNSDLYAFELSFSDGKSHGMNLSRKYLWTPTAADVGTYKMSIAVRDNLGAVLDTGSVTLNVVPAPKSPSEEKVVLVVGDSLTDGGVWASELYRRLTATGGTPAGAGLANVRFIGTRATANGVRYEGYGGWTFDSYTTAYTGRQYFMYIHGTFDPDTLTQHSVYKDANGQLWKLESIEATKIKIIAVQSVGGDIQQYGTALPATGELTYYGGGTSAETITYTSSEKAEGNPFWNLEAGKVDFTSYAEAQGVDRIDEVIVLLGWNNTNLTGSALAAKAKGFIDLIHAEFPDCHVTLVGLQVPSRDGFAFSYGTSWNYYEKLCTVFEFQTAFMELAASEEYADTTSFVSLAGQFDAENNYPTKNIPIGGENASGTTTSRDNRTETVQSNGVHPSPAGYYQIADAVYRHIAARWQ